MTFIARAAGAFLPLVLLLPLPAIAQESCFVQASAADQPQYARPDDPWIYRGTDIPEDENWLFGELPTGLRYAVRQNDVPPCQMSLRVRIDAGSLHENDAERGYAHLLEHMVFRESSTFGPGEAIPHFQRLGASFGFDTNATTSPTATTFKLDLPNANRTTMDDSVRRFAGMVAAPTLSSANLAADLPIVLAERRESAGAQRRVADQTTATFFAGQRLAERSPIGTAEALEAATQESVRAFHRRWYRPENAVVVLVGDADPQVLAAMVERHFADWRGEGPLTPAPDFGDPQAPAGADGENPVGELTVIVEPGQPRGLTYAIMRPWVEVVDNLEYNRQNLLGSVATAVVNRRLENRARAGGSYLFAGVQRDKISRSVDGTFVTFAPLTEDWEAALVDVRGVIADALASPPSQAEIDQAVASFDVAFVDSVEQSRIQAGSLLADDITNAVDIREAVASPETFLEVFRSIAPRFTPEQVQDATRELFQGEVIRGVMMVPAPGEVTEAELRTALSAPVVASDDARDNTAAVNFADLPAIGEPAAPTAVQPLGVLGAERLTFANGVRALILGRDNEPGRVTVRVRFGDGMAGVAADEGVYAELGELALVNSGIGPLGQNDLDRLAADLKVGFDFDIGEGAFTFQGLTRQEDLEEQLYLFAAKLAMPSWDPAPFERARASALIAYESYGRDPNGVLNRDLEWLLHDRDPRYATADAATLRAATPEQFRAVWERLLAQGPVEVDVFGDIDRQATIDALSRTFGALADRTPVTAVAAPDAGFPAGGPDATTLTHSGDPDQAAALIAWPLGGGSEGIVQSRKLDLLAQVFSNRLLDGLRERAGAAYTPFATSSWPLDRPDGGYLFALVQIEPSLLPAFFDEAEEIASDLATNGPTADELERVIEPARQYLLRAQTGHTFWLNQLQGAAFDTNRLVYLPSIFRDVDEATPAELQALAQRYLSARPGWRLQVVPAAASTAAPAAAAAGR
ncbi:insulinase family protein [Erythrobacter arachoides]|uniref:Insulinase family protein n=1 Tax=Aurantiacibacter arachoides TaxID=1850444 RepID=A0A845A2P4_9SPHN|nr:M16 family metallopeptidase [Aurantiacibacter arachoides]MXO93702.1 insulinase family protein [Aurantiacibacter arachoides]GGD47302.1 peptidase M16 [Aurantiacibacter arachoides]